MSDNWLDTPSEESYEAALNYLGLILNPEQAAEGIETLRKVDVTMVRAADVIRASGHPVLAFTNDSVRRAHEQMTGDKLSPVLLFRAYPMIVADGFERACAAYHVDPDIEIPCQIV